MLKQLDMFQSETSQSVIHGDCLDIMKSMSDNSIDFIVTDPPYSLSFMGKKWDDSLPSIEIWKEALRICKPGAWLASFGGTRTYHRLTCNIEDSGWGIRDCIMWLYGSGFPKGKGCLKPAYEPIVLARKKDPSPILNIDECRIECEKFQCNQSNSNEISYRGKKYADYPNKREKIFHSHQKGRWPANLILDEEAAQELDQQSGITKSSEVRPCKRKTNGQYSGSFPDNINCFESNSGGASRFFYCAKASSSERNRGLEGMPLKETGIKNASGRGFSESDPYAKRMAYNNHPTVKPISLMKYILKLLAPPGNPTCLDPFCGSGSTILAAKELGINCIGIEKEAEYVEIAKARIK